MTRKMRVAALVLCLVMLVGLIGGCASSTGTTSTDTGSTSSSSSSSATTGTTTTATQAPAASTDSGEATADAGLSLPYEETLPIRFWQVLNTKYVTQISSFDEMPFFVYMQEKMNVDFIFEEPTADVAQEQFGLMIAAGNWPDIIQSVETYYPGGLAAAHEDGIIIELTEYINNGTAPWIQKIYETFPQFAQMATWNGSQYLDLPFFRNNGNLYNEGIMLRKDLLDKYGYELPETIADLEEVLYAMKDWEEIQIPFSTIGAKGLIEGIAVSSAWDLKYNWYQDAANHEVKYGAVQPEYKEIATMLHKWYVDGILDVDFVTNDRAAQNAKIAEGIVGVWYGAGGGDGTTPWGAAIEADPETEMVVFGIRPVSGEEGADPKVAMCSFNYEPTGSCAVSTNCAEPEKVIYAVDYMGYSDEGRAVLFYGIEGEHYTLEEDGRFNVWADVDGSAQNMYSVTGVEPFTPKFYEHPSCFFSGLVKWDTAEFLHQEDPAIYVPRWYSDSDTSVDTIKAKASATRRAEWIPLWKGYDPVNNLPYITFNTEEAALIAELNTEIDTYVKETLTAFILGTQDIESTWDSYVEGVYDMGLQELLDLYQSKVNAAYGL